MSDRPMGLPSWMLCVCMQALCYTSDHTFTRSRLSTQHVTCYTIMAVGRYYHKMLLPCSADCILRREATHLHPPLVHDLSLPTTRIAPESHLVRIGNNKTRRILSSLILICAIGRAIHSRIFPLSCRSAKRLKSLFMHLLPSIQTYGTGWPHRK